MSATPTPRTDATCADYSGPLCWIGEKQFLPADFARTLEREMAEANSILAALQELHGCSRGMVAHWCGHAAERSLAVGRMRNELAVERERVRAKLLTPEPKRGMKVNGLRILRANGRGYSEMRSQMAAHLEELARRYYGGEVCVVDEFLQLYCVGETERAALARTEGGG